MPATKTKRKCKLKYIVYLLTFPNGKKYVGLTKQGTDVRWKDHCCRAKNKNFEGYTYPLYRAIRRDGAENVKVETLHRCKTFDRMCELEIFEVKNQNSHINNSCGYNLSEGGRGCTGYEWTEDQKRKASDAQNQPDVKRRKSISMKEYTSKPGSKKKSIDAAKKVWSSLELRKKASDSAKKRFDRPGSRKKASDAMSKPESVLKCVLTIAKRNGIEPSQYIEKRIYLCMQRIKSARTDKIRYGYEQKLKNMLAAEQLAVDGGVIIINESLGSRVEARVEAIAITEAEVEAKVKAEIKARAKVKEGLASKRLNQPETILKGVLSVVKRNGVELKQYIEKRICLYKRRVTGAKTKNRCEGYKQRLENMLAAERLAIKQGLITV